MFQECIFIHLLGSLENAVEHRLHDTVHLLCTVGGWTVALLLMLGSVVALINCDPFRVLRGVVILPCGSSKNAATTVTAIDIPGEESFADDSARIGSGRTDHGGFTAIRKCYCFRFPSALNGVIDGSLFPCFCYPLELLQRDDLQIRKYL